VISYVRENIVVWAMVILTKRGIENLLEQAILESFSTRRGNVIARLTVKRGTSPTHGMGPGPSIRR
jgi:hypothetical protein